MNGVGSALTSSEGRYSQTSSQIVGRGTCEGSKGGHGEKQKAQRLQGVPKAGGGPVAVPGKKGENKNKNKIKQIYIYIYVVSESALPCMCLSRHDTRCSGPTLAHMLVVLIPEKVPKR